MNEVVGLQVRTWAASAGVPAPDAVEYLIWRGLHAVKGESIQSGIAHRRDGRTERAKATLRERYPDGVLPKGAQRRLAEELQMSAVLVNQAARALGYVVAGT